MQGRLVAVLCLAALAGCASVRDDRAPPGASLDGRAMTVTASNGQVTTLEFDGDGGVRANFAGREAAGRWVMGDDKLCFTWAGNFRECWPYAVPLRRGETRAITSDRGNVVRVTMR